MDRLRADIVIVNANEVLTCVPGADNPAGRRTGASIAIAGELILAVGASEELAYLVDVSDAKFIDATDRVVAPGFVDCHTHLVFGGSRVEEYAASMTMDPAEITALGIPTGILSSVAMTRKASVDALTESALNRVQRMFLCGTTTVESKSGYGLSLPEELKILAVNRRLQENHPVDVVSTFLGAHAFPTGVSHNDYVDIVVKQMIPRVAEEGLAVFCDVFCETGYFTVEQSRRILEAGMKHDLQPKIHLDEYCDLGGAAMAAELPVVSADHLNHTTRESMQKLSSAGTVGVVMPALDFAVQHERPFDARAMIDESMTIALATDMCPGCWMESMQVVMQMACRAHGLSPAEALIAATAGAAEALELDNDRGTLEPGKLADIQIWDVPVFEDVIYRIGNNAVDTIIKRGQVFKRHQTVLT